MINIFSFCRLSLGVCRRLSKNSIQCEKFMYTAPAHLKDSYLWDHASVPLPSSGELPQRFHFWLTSEKNASTERSYFSWTMNQSAGTFGHYFGGSEFTIGTFIEWHILRTNWRLQIDGLRVKIGQRFWRCHIHSYILFFWHLLWLNWIRCSDFQLLPIEQRFCWRCIHSDVLFWWKILWLIQRWRMDCLRLPFGRRHAQWPGLCRQFFETNQEVVLVETKR